MPIKKRTKSQRVGARGENAFRHIASSIGLLPTKVEEDFGIDFLCQVERDSNQAVTDITGTLLGVAVRATSSRRGRIRLNRDDVETLLNCRFPVMISLVKLGTAPTDDLVYLRLIDGEFAIELAESLSTAVDEISFTPGSFISHSDASQLIAQATSHGFSETISLLLTQHGLSRVLPNAHIQIQRSAEGQLSLIRTSDILSQFDVSSEEAKMRLNTALFGSEKHIAQRMTQLPLRKEIWRSLKSLPQPVVIAGQIVTGKVTLIVEESPARCEFEARSGIGYIAYVHASGFSIRMSEAKSLNGHMVHYIDAVIDPDIDISYREHKDLWNFLAECAPDRHWKREDWPGKGVSLDESGDLYHFAWFAHYLSQTEGAIAWSSNEWYLSDGKSDEVLNSLALARLAIAEPEFLSGSAITVLKDRDTEEVAVSLTVPACSNLPRGGLILWLHAEGTALLKDEGIGGVIIRRIMRVAPEFVDAVFSKSTSKPELVIYSKWPTVALGPTPELTSSDASAWGYETQLTIT